MINKHHQKSQQIQHSSHTCQTKLVSVCLTYKVKTQEVISKSLVHSYDTCHFMVSEDLQKWNWAKWVGQLVIGALSQVDSKGLYQGWGRISQRDIHLKRPIRQKEWESRVVWRICGMKYSLKGHKDRNRHKNKMKRSGQARLVYVKDINHKIRWGCD